MDNENAGRFAVGADPIWPHNEKDREKEERKNEKKCARNVPGMCARDVTQWETVRNCADNVRNCADSVRNCAAALRAISRRSPGGTTRCIPKISPDV